MIDTYRAAEAHGPRPDATALLSLKRRAGPLSGSPRAYGVGTGSLQVASFAGNRPELR